MRVSVARGTGLIAQNRVDAFRHGRGFVGMAGGALYFGDFHGMRKFFDGGVAVAAGENSMGAGRVRFGTDRDVFAFFGLHAGLAVAGEARLILF